MILGIGVDIIDVQRFADWHTKSEAELLRVFAPQEIAYCLHENKQLSAERFAVRFAAREAFFKAYQAMLVALNISGSQNLLAVQKEVHVTHLHNGVPSLTVNWDTLLPKAAKRPSVHVSLSHAANTAVAMVVLEQAD